MQEINKRSFGINLQLFLTSNKQNVLFRLGDHLWSQMQLEPFQGLDVYCMFAVEVTTMSGGILADDMGLEKVRYLLLLI